MQTFLPYEEFLLSAKCLDRQRLGKQRVECKQIYSALVNPTYGWQSHPAVQMWRGYEQALALYGFIICSEWIDRGYADSLLPWFRNRLIVNHPASFPTWLGNAEFHASHRANLLRKNPEWYGQFNWSESPLLPYVWPKAA